MVTQIVENQAETPKTATKKKMSSKFPTDAKSVSDLSVVIGGDARSNVSSNEHFSSIVLEKAIK